MLIFALPIRNEGDNKSSLNNDFVAQLVEQYTFNVWVLGSSPNGITFKNESRSMSGFFILRCFGNHVCVCAARDCSLEDKTNNGGEQPEAIVSAPNK